MSGFIEYLKYLFSFRSCRLLADIPLMGNRPKFSRCLPDQNCNC